MLSDDECKLSIVIVDVMNESYRNIYIIVNTSVSTINNMNNPLISRNV